MKRLLKWGLIAFVLAEIYSRGGREFLFGEMFDPDDGGDTFRIWIDLPMGVTAPLGRCEIPVRNPNGDTVGRVIEVSEKIDATDMAGYPAQQLEVHGEFNRYAFGYPINVAVAQAEDWTRSTLGVA